MAPVIFKIKFYNNRVKDKTIQKNIAHINYIATRPGVDRSSDLSIELDEELDLDNAESHVKYMSERPRSHGLFDDKYRVIDLKDVKSEIKEHKGVIWRSVLSLKEEDAVKLGYVDRKQWEETLRSHMPEAVKTMGIEETNLRWVAAFHQEKGHPHCHIMFWEKNTKRTRGKLGEWEISKMKKVFVKGLYEKERSRLYVEKTAKRDLIRDLAKGDLVKAVNLIRETRKENSDVKILEGNKAGVVQKLWTDKEKELSKHVVELSEMMPGKGRVALKYMPEDVKKKVEEISNWILDQPGFNKNMDIIKGDAVELAKQYTDDTEKLARAQDKAYIDIKNRVSQIVLKAAAESKLDNIALIDKEKADIAVDLLKNASELNLRDEKTEVLSKAANSVSYLNKNLSGDINVEKNVFMINQRLNIDLNDNEVRSVIKNIPGEVNPDEVFVGLKLISQDDKFLNEFIDKNVDEVKKYIKSCIDTDQSKYGLYKIKVHGDLNESYKFVPDKLERAIIKNIINKGEFTLENLVNETSITKNINTNEEFKFGKYDANVIFKQFNKRSNELTYDKLEERVFKYNKSEAAAEKQYSIMVKRIDKLVQNGYAEKKGDIFKITDKGFTAAESVNTKFEFTSYDANVLGKYIDDAKGELTGDKLMNMLKSEYKDDKYIDKQFDYITKRLDNNVKSGYMIHDTSGNYRFTDKGLLARQNELNGEDNKFNIPIKDKLEHFKKLDVVTEKDGVYKVNDKEELKNVLNNNREKVSTIAEVNKYISSNEFITGTDIEKICSQIKKEINSKYENTKTDYENVRNNFGIKSIEKETVRSMSKVLLNAGTDKEEVNSIINNFKNKAHLKMSDEEINGVIDKEYKIYKEGTEWNRPQRISNKEWNNLFKNLGYEDKEIPKNMYMNSHEKGKFVDMSSTNIASKVWKAAWRALEKEKYKEEIKARMIKRQLENTRDRYNEREE